MTYDDGLTPDVLEEIIHKAIAERDFPTVGAALTVLKAGLILAERRLAAEAGEPAK